MVAPIRDPEYRVFFNEHENGNSQKIMKIYFAGPLFTQAERLWNRRISDELRKLKPSIEIILPQDEAADAFENGSINFARLFQGCIEGIEKSDVVVANLDGSDSDSGTSFECGYAFAIGKPVLGVRTDFRASEDRGLNAMLSQSCAAIVYFSSTNESISKLGALISATLEKVVQNGKSHRSAAGFRD